MTLLEKENVTLHTQTHTSCSFTIYPSFQIDSYTLVLYFIISYNLKKKLSSLFVIINIYYMFNLFIFKLYYHIILKTFCTIFN